MSSENRVSFHVPSAGIPDSGDLEPPCQQGETAVGEANETWKHPADCMGICITYVVRRLPQWNVCCLNKKYKAMNYIKKFCDNELYKPMNDIEYYGYKMS